MSSASITNYWCIRSHATLASLPFCVGSDTCSTITLLVKVCISYTCYNTSLLLSQHSGNACLIDSDKQQDYTTVSVYGMVWYGIVEFKVPLDTV